MVPDCVYDGDWLFGVSTVAETKLKECQSVVSVEEGENAVGDGTGYQFVCCFKEVDSSRAVVVLDQGVDNAVLEGGGGGADEHWGCYFKEPFKEVGRCMEELFTCCAHGATSLIQFHAFEGVEEFFCGGERFQAGAEVILEGLMVGAVGFW